MSNRIILAVLLLAISARGLLCSSKKMSPCAFNIAIPKFDKPPKIDGKLEDPVWIRGAVINRFTQYEPVEGKEPTERTVAYIGYDRDNLYIAIRCFDSNPEAVRACLVQRDKVENDDEVTVYLDTFNDKKRAFVFRVNPCGVQTDGIYIEGRRRRQGSGGPDRIDKTWDTFFVTDAYVDDEGYNIEMSIPFKSIRFPNSDEQIWGFQIKRNIRRKNEEIYWHPRSRDVNGFLVQSGTILINGQLNKGKNLEIMPVVSGLKKMADKIAPESGLNVKYGITSNLTADATVNPDFSQIEADMPQIEVNQRYELYYPEKRPFFLEGKDFYDTPFELVYTRTIADPRWGTKLSGKIGKTTLGFLSAYDLNTSLIQTVLDEEDGDDEDDEPACRSLVNVFRLKQDLLPESYIGLILTDKEMALQGHSINSSYNRVVGFDGHFKFRDHYRFSFQVVGSKTKKDDYESGFVPAMMLNFNRHGRHLQLSAEYVHIPPDFEASTGFFERKDIRSLNTRLSYTFLPMTDVIVDIRPSIEYKRIYDFDNILTDEQVRFGFYASGWRGTYMWGRFVFSTERYKGVNYRKKWLRLTLEANPVLFLSSRITFGVGDGIYYDDNHYLGYKYSYGVEMNLRPLTNLLFSYNFNNNSFYKSRGGRLEYKINLISQRINYQISRHLSLRLITDYNDYDKELYNSILLSYELVPGTVFYVGMDDNQFKLDRDRYVIEGRFVFIKLSYWWRI